MVHPFGHNRVRAIPQEHKNLWMTLGKGSLSPIFKMAEFSATRPEGGALARSDGLGITISTELGILCLALQITRRSPVTTDLKEDTPHSSMPPPYL